MSLSFLFFAFFLKFLIFFLQFLMIASTQFESSDYFLMS